jgi:hypothetical protein
MSNLHKPMKTVLVFAVLARTLADPKHKGVPGTTWSEGLHKFVFTDIVGTCSSLRSCSLLTTTRLRHQGRSLPHLLCRFWVRSMGSMQCLVWQ